MTQLEEGPTRPARLHLLVVGPNTFATHPLQDRGVVTVGRGENNAVRVDDPLVSRNHLELEVGPTLRVRDLGSGNGTRLRGERLAANEPVELAIGDLVALGSTVLIVQPSMATVRPRRLWSHGYFEGRLEEECARADRAGASFAIARIQLLESSAKVPVAEILATAFRASDVLATYGPDDYEVLLADAEPADAPELIRRVTRQLEDVGVRARTALAMYPGDGRTPEELVARATSLVRGTAPAGAPAVVVEDEAMRRLYRLLERAAAGTINVLILGETGVGKEVIAEHVHRVSPRAGNPFLRLNCAALSDSLLESELFGHERGAFTGAIKQKPGLLETASGGTVFLDEVGELSAAIQAKLLRVIELRQVMRVGGLEPLPIDVRFLSATNRDLEAEVTRGTFRRDLYFRLCGFTVIVPPLRDRVSEIEMLARTFVSQASRDAGRASEPTLSAAALAALKQYSWPGNIRELRNVIERAVLLCPGNEITTELLPVEKMGAMLAVGHTGVPEVLQQLPAASGLDLRARKDELPDDPDTQAIRRILDALNACAGNQTHAARMLGVSRRTLVKWLAKYHLPRPRKRVPPPRKA